MARIRLRRWLPTCNWKVSYRPNQLRIGFDAQRSFLRTVLATRWGNLAHLDNKHPQRMYATFSIELSVLLRIVSATHTPYITLMTGQPSKGLDVFGIDVF